MTTTRAIANTFIVEVQRTLRWTLPNGNNSSIDISGVAFSAMQNMFREGVSSGNLLTKTIVSTYSLVYTTTGAYAGGVLAPNGDIHFVPLGATVGQKLDAYGIVSTYSLVYTTTSAYTGGVLASNGDVHFIASNATRGQKYSISGVVSTYSLVYTTTGAYYGGVLAPNGDIHFIPLSANRGQKISTLPAIPFSLGVCCSPWFNKF